MKLCVNCKFYKEDKIPTAVKGLVKTRHLCYRQGQHVSPITGAVLWHSPKDCKDERGYLTNENYKNCSPDGKYFQEKEVIVKKRRFWHKVTLF